MSLTTSMPAIAMAIVWKVDVSDADPANWASAFGSGSYPAPVVHRCRLSETLRP